MSILKYRVKFMEAFKDGNILGGKFFGAGSIHVIDESDMVKIQNSGGVFDTIETLIPNPLKTSPEAAALLAEHAEKEAQAAKAKEAEIAQAEQVIKRKPGRPKKNAA